MDYICACLGLQRYNFKINKNSKDLLNAKEKKRKTQNFRNKNKPGHKENNKFENGE